MTYVPMPVPELGYPDACRDAGCVLHVSRPDFDNIEVIHNSDGKTLRWPVSRTMIDDRELDIWAAAKTWMEGLHRGAEVHA